MAVCIQKRVYDNVALDSWKEKIKHSWETFFTKQELKLGREIYRNGEIRELELTEYDIIVHAKFDQDMCYGLVEWSKGKFNIKGSSKDKLLARSLAVAGLYDVEALVAKSAGAEEVDSVKSVPDRAALIEQTMAIRKKSKEQQARDLVLEFNLEKKGIVFKALWQDDEVTRLPALKSETYTPGDANELEREKLIGLASVARKNGFKYNSKQGIYELKDLEKIKVFMDGQFEDKWGGRFIIENDDGITSLSKGIQRVDLLVDLDTQESGALDFCWHMSVDGRILEAEDARELIRNTGKPVIVPQVGLIELEEEKMEMLATWQRWLSLYSDGMVPRYALFSLFGEEPIKLVLSTELKKWKDSLYQMNEGKHDLPDFLRPYQKQGVKWMAHICDRDCHGLLADEMGLGKTIQVLSFITSRNIYDLPNLIVCPAGVVPVWQKEIERFFPHLRVDVLRSGHDFYKTDKDVLWLASYTQLRMHKFLLDSVNFGYVILDEAQLIKNPEAKVSQACMEIRSKHRLVLTGTPLENKYLDLWTIFRFLMPGLLGTRKHFEDLMNSGDPKKFRERIKKQIAPFVLRRTKQDVLKELPDKTETDLICPLTELQRREYSRLTREGVKELGEDIPRAVSERSLSFLTLLTRLRQTCCDPSLLPWMSSEYGESGKILMLVDKLTEILNNGHKVVVFSQFVSLLARVARAINAEFPQVPIYHLTGKTLDRAKPVDEFQNLDGEGVILVSLRAGGTGITLHSADYVFLMDPWWNPAVEEQAIDRVHRFGQDKPVFVYRMVTEGTIEARIQKLKSDKKGIFSGILGGMSDISDIKNYFDSLSELIELLPEDE